MMIKVLVAGDFCPQDRVAKHIENNEYETVFGNIVDYTSEADYSILNLEAPILNLEGKPIKKYGPNLKAHINTIYAIKYAGFDMVTLANNHFYDYGDDGVRQTLDACKKEGIDVVGGGMNMADASQTFYKEIKGIRVAIINCCEHEFSIATESSGGSNPLNPIQQYYAIQDAKMKADKVVVIVHGGHEGYQLPSPRMKETYRFFVDAGADAVINHHQHCYSGYEVYQNKPIVYGLGNFSFDWPQYRNSIWNEGYMVMLNFEGERVSFETIPYLQGNENVGINVLKDKTNFNSEILRLNSFIINESKLEQEFYAYVKKTQKEYLLVLEPFYNRFINALYRRGLIPSFIPRKKKYFALNYIKCESHCDRFKQTIINNL